MSKVKVDRARARARARMQRMPMKDWEPDEVAPSGWRESRDIILLHSSFLKMKLQDPNIAIALDEEALKMPGEKREACGNYFYLSPFWREISIVLSRRHQVKIGDAHWAQSILLRKDIGLSLQMKYLHSIDLIDMIMNLPHPPFVTTKRNGLRSRVKYSFHGESSAFILG